MLIEKVLLSLSRIIYTSVMAENVTPERTIKIRAAIDEGTHRALKQEQSRRELETGNRPHMTELVALLLTEWALESASTGG